MEDGEPGAGALRPLPPAGGKERKFRLVGQPSGDHLGGEV